MILLHTGERRAPSDLLGLPMEYLEAPVCLTVDRLAYASLESKPVGGWGLCWTGNDAKLTTTLEPVCQ